MTEDTEQARRAYAESATGVGSQDATNALEDEESSAAAQVDRDLEQLANERNEYLETLRRVQADFENYRKRVLREQTTLVERATAGIIEQLLPVLDSFSLAVGNLGEAPEKVRRGVELVYAELVGVLEKAGLSRIEAEGQPFDPNEHEAVMQEQGDGDPVVAEILRNGYRLKGRVVRPAMVKVTH